jgi:hypothetical protein
MLDGLLAAIQGGPQPAAEPQAQAAQPATPTQGQDTLQQWNDWMSTPDNRAALVQFGLQLMQPVGLGQTPGGHFAQAVGSVGELGTRREEMDNKQRTLERQEADSDSLRTYRRDQADIGQERAGAQMLNAQSLARFRMAQEQVLTERAGKLQAEIGLLEAKTLQFPADAALKQQLAQAKIALQQTQSGLNQIRGGTIQQNADTRRMDTESKITDRSIRSDIGQQNANTATRRGETLDRAVGVRERQGDQRLGIAERRAATGDRAIDARSEAKMRTDYQKYMSDFRLMGVKGQPLSYPQFKEQYELTRPQPAPTAPAPAAPGRRLPPEGTVLRNKSSGTLEVVRGGELVPYEPQ